MSGEFVKCLESLLTLFILSRCTSLKDSVVRVYSPQPKARPEATRSIERLFVIELTQRSFFCQALSEESMHMWIAALNAVTQNTRSIRRNSRASMFFDSSSRMSLLFDSAGSASSLRSSTATSARTSNAGTSAGGSSAGSSASMDVQNAAVSKA